MGLNSNIQQEKLKTLNLIGADLDMLLSEKQYERYIELAIKVTIENVYDHRAFQFILKLLLKCLEIEKKHLNNKSLRAKLLNALANLSKAHGYQQLSVNIYFVAFLYLEKSDRFKCYCNLGNAFSELNDEITAYKYRELAIDSLHNVTPEKINPSDKKHYLFLFTLNKILSLLILGKVDKATELFKKSDFHLFENKDRSNYQYVLSLIEFHNLKEKKFESFYELKDSYYSQKKFRSIIKINNFILDNDDSLNSSAIESLLIENHLLGKELIDNKFHKESIVALIKFYQQKEDADKTNEYLLHLFEFDQNLKQDYSNFFLNIYMNEIENIFDQLIHTNLSLEHKRIELENITHILSHDLKTPLRTIKSFAGLLKKDVSKNDFSRVDEHLGFIRQSSQHLYDLIEDVNLLKKIDRDIDQREKVDLEQVGEAIRINLDYMVYKRNAKIIFEGKLPVVHINYASISILFQNFIENGLKYNESETPTIIIRSKIKDTDLELQFIDNGIGIKEEYFEKIFVLFKRLHNEERYDGTGFGLGICNKIVKSYGGKIKIDSKFGEGSCFTILLPRIVSV